MPYAKSTVSSRSRSRPPTPLPSPPPDRSGVTAQLFPSARRPPLRSRVEGGPWTDAKRPRPTPRRTPSPPPSDQQERVRLSQELTSQCGAAAARAQALLHDRVAQQRRMHDTLRQSLERSPLRQTPPSPAGPRAPPPTPLSAPPPSQSAAGATPSPAGPRAPPPTPVSAGGANQSAAGANQSAAGANQSAAGANQSAGGATPSPGWTSRFLRASPAKSPSPPPSVHGGDASLLQRVGASLRRLSGRGPSTPPAESPRRSRKSVVFSEPAESTAPTPGPRESAVYPPAPPPSAAKTSPRRSRSSSVESTSPPRGKESSEPAAEEPEDSEEEDENEEEQPDVGAVIRDLPRSRAFRLLTKTRLVEYGKEHHIVLSLKSSKRELFDVARRLAINSES